MRVTLQSRITVSIIIFIIFLVSAFCFVQLQNQLHIITIFNSLKAKMTAQILQEALQRTLRETPAGENYDKAIAASLKVLKQSGVIESMLVYSPEGIIKTATDSRIIGMTASADELARIEEAAAAPEEKTSFVSYIAKAKRILQLYIPIALDKKVLYVAQLDISLGNMAEAMRQVYMPIIAVSIVVILATIVFGVILSKRVIGPILILNTATKEVAAGDLNLRIHMDTNDELQELADTFNVMAIELKKMKARAENANPLTKLPGNIVIQEEVEKRIKSNSKFMVIYCDLDNFKAFNDKYGIHAGDDAIQLTAKVFKEAVANLGNPDDFIGHEGGDDFILLTTPDKAYAIGEHIKTQFGKRVRDLYKQEDLDRGYIEAKARHSEEIVKFPIMTISLAGVTNEARPIASYGEVTNIAAEVKKKAKATPGSCLVVDKREH